MFKVAILGAVGLVVAGCGTAGRDQVAESRQAESTCLGVVIHNTSDAESVRGCRRFRGDVTIEGTSLKDMSALQNVEQISGTLLIVDNSALLSLDGLASLSQVENLVVTGNVALSSLRGLSHLVKAKGITIAASPSLKTLAGLESLSELDGLVVSNTGVTSLDAMARLTHVNDLVLTDNANLQNLSGLRELQRADNIDIERNPALNQMGPFTGLKSPCADGIVTSHWQPARAANAVLWNQV